MTPLVHTQELSHLDCIIIVPHVDEREASRPTGLMIEDNLYLIHRPILRKHLTKVTLLSVQTQAKHAQAPACLRIVLHIRHQLTLRDHSITFDQTT